MVNDLGEIESCECGGVNISIGPITLHFNIDEFIKFVELVDAGVDMINPDTEEDFIINEDDAIN